MIHRTTRQEGNALMLTIIAFTLMAGLSAAQVTFFVKNQQQANFFELRSELREAAESGLSLAIHDLKSTAGDTGLVGTVEWSADTDFGADGYPGTLDHGESDGLPTAGEPGVVPVPFGSNRLGMGLYTTVTDTAFAGVRRVVATATNGGESITVEKLVQTTDAFTIPDVGALAVDPNVALDFNGNAFFISGNDTNPDGSDGPGDDLAALTIEADPDNPGDNLASLLSQIDEPSHDQLEGAGGYPSLSETTEADVSELADQLLTWATPMESGRYRDTNLGNWASEDFQFLKVSGDLNLDGTAEGAGILIVDGNLTISGQFRYHGLILVRGDLRVVGGGTVVHNYGSVMVTESFSAVEHGRNRDHSELTVSGTADLYYSSVVIDTIQSAFQSAATVSTLYYKEI